MRALSFESSARALNTASVQRQLSMPQCAIKMRAPHKAAWVRRNSSSPYSELVELAYQTVVQRRRVEIDATGTVTKNSRALGLRTSASSNERIMQACRGPNDLASQNNRRPCTDAYLRLWACARPASVDLISVRSASSIRRILPERVNFKSLCSPF